MDEGTEVGTLHDLEAYRRERTERGTWPPPPSDAERYWREFWGQRTLTDEIKKKVRQCREELEKLMKKREEPQPHEREYGEEDVHRGRLPPDGWFL